MTEPAREAYDPDTDLPPAGAEVTIDGHRFAYDDALNAWTVTIAGRQRLARPFSVEGLAVARVYRDTAWQGQRGR